MHIVIIGGGGMLGRKLALALGRRGEIGGRAISHMALMYVEPYRGTE